MTEYQFPSSESNDPQEVRFAYLLPQYTNDPIFLEQLRELGWMPQAEKTICQKQELDQFIQEHGYKPSQYSKDPIEKKLGNMASHWVTRSNPGFDESLKEKYQNIPTWEEFKTGKHKQDLAQFIKTYGYRPSTGSKDPIEKKLGMLYNNYSNKLLGQYDPKLVEQYKDIPTCQKYKTNQDKKELTKFIKKHGYRPSGVSKDPKEQRLGKLCNDYMGKLSGSFDLMIFELYKNIPTSKDYKLKKSLTNPSVGVILPVGQQNSLTEN